MKKLVFSGIIALILIVSGIAAVGAFEGHLVDIKAHVENAIGVETYELDYGVTFPQEHLEKALHFGLSESFMESTRISSLSYGLFWELKPIAGHDPVPEPAYMTDYFQPLNPFLTVDADQATIDTNAVDDIPAPGGYVKFGQGVLYNDSPTGACETLHFWFNVPVFEGYYNAVTETYVNPNGWPYMLEEGEFVTELEDICNFETLVPHADLGINLKIQVLSYGYET